MRMPRAAVALVSFVALARGDVDADAALCRAYVAANANATRRAPSGALRFPYLVPAGPYEQEWDWDAVFLGVATARCCGGAAYLAGSMKNFFAATNASTGEVPGCLAPTLPAVCSSDANATAGASLAHAKPVLIQGAWLSVDGAAVTAREFRPFRAAMEALLSYWARPPRRDARTGLRVWHDQLESGADDLVLSRCPSARSPECWSDAQAFTLASVDATTLLLREHIAFARFVRAWGGPDAERDAAAHDARAAALARALDESLWDDARGHHVARNVSAAAAAARARVIGAKTYQIAMPLWARAVRNASRAAAIVAALARPELLSPWGLRSTSSDDARYSNAETLVPYSNWRGPVWVVANAMAAYGLAAHGARDAALDLAARVVGVLADDLRASGTWHEAYSAENGSALAAPGFLSWNTLAADLIPNLRAGIDPFELR